MKKIESFIYDKGIMFSGMEVNFSAILYAQEFADELNLSLI